LISTQYFHLHTHNFYFYFRSQTELGIDEHSCSHRTTSVASHESIHCHTGWKGCRRDSTKLMSCWRWECH
jgi:hypothetical protein